MLPKQHALVGIVVGFLAWLIFSIPWYGVLIIFLSSFLIDVDHYLLFVYKEKDFSVKNSYELGKKINKKWKSLGYKEKREYKCPIFILHGIEFWIILVLLSFVHNIFFWIFIGITIHMIIDLIELVQYRDPLYFKFSQIFNLIFNKTRTKDAWSSEFTTSSTSRQ